MAKGARRRPCIRGFILMSATNLLKTIGVSSCTLLREAPFVKLINLSRLLLHTRHCLFSKMTATVVMIRHGESVWNSENRFCGWHDADLSDLGISEAKNAGAVR